jgi:GNAT superfamily N-acetyltransferase
MLHIRPAAIHDLALLRTMIRELADYEHELDLVTITEEDLARDGFGKNPRFRAVIAEWDEQPAGYALFFDYYSTWAGRGLFLEDLFVRRAFRSRGIGKALLAAVARIAVEEHCYGIHWEVLDWNEKAIDLYMQLGAKFRDQWRPVLLADRLCGDWRRKPCEKEGQDWRHERSSAIVCDSKRLVSEAGEKSSQFARLVVAAGEERVGPSIFNLR